MMTILLVLLFFLPTHYASITKRIFYWDVPPYIWKENGRVKGIFKQSIEVSEKLCNHHFHSEFYRVKGGYKGFVRALNRQTYVETDKGNITTNFTDSWVPFMNSSEENLSLHFLKTMSTSNEMVVVVPRYKIEILYKIGLGLLRSGNFVVICLILALLAGITVWFIVSCAIPAISKCGIQLNYSIANHGKTKDLCLCNNQWQIRSIFPSFFPFFT